MKWFKHENTYNNPKIEMLTDKHGIIGYGVYFRILELIASSIEESNQDEWGYLPSIYTNQYLAKKLQVDEKQLEEIFFTCFDLNLLESRDDTVFCQKVLERCDDYTQRLLNQSKKGVGTNSEQSPTKKRIRKEEDKNIKEREKKIETSLSYLEKLPEEDITKFTTDLEVNKKQVQAKAMDLFHYCKAKGKTYRDYKAFLRNALYKDFKPRRVVASVPKIPDMTPEEHKKAAQKFEEMKKNFLTNKPEKAVDYSDVPF